MTAVMLGELARPHHTRAPADPVRRHGGGLMVESRLVYVAGPISGDPFGCVRQAIAAFTELRDLGLVPFLPQLSVLSEMVHHRSYDEWLTYDLDVIRHCAALVRLPGESPGADQECEFALSLDLPVFRLPGDRAGLQSWASQRGAIR